MLKGLTGKSIVNSLSADMFADYFKAINDPKDAFIFNERYVNGEFQVMFDEPNENLSESEIRKAINQLKLGK